MKHKSHIIALVAALLLGATWQTADCQSVVQNPTTFQTITQPAGTSFSVVGVQYLGWPTVSIDQENSSLVFRDVTQSDAWFMSLTNDGSSTGGIRFFGNFTNGGSLIPFSAGTTNVGTTAAPWTNVVAREVRAVGTGFRFPDGSLQATAQVAGPTGPAGPSGPTGPAGPQGPQGPAGPQTAITLSAHCAGTFLPGDAVVLNQLGQTSSQFCSSIYLGQQVVHQGEFGESQPGGGTFPSIPMRQATPR